MANYSTLKAAVQNVVKTNGNKAITGANLQAVLLSIINSVGGGGYIFKGVATPSTNAGTPDENVFYIGGAGTYANFGASVTIPVGSIGVFKYNGSWAKEQITLFAGIDDEPTEGSNNLVTSGGICTGIEKYLSDNFGKSLLTSSSDVQVCSHQLSTSTILFFAGNTCLASVKRKKIIVPSVLDVTCEAGYKYIIAFCQNYGNGNVSLNTGYSTVAPLVTGYSNKHYSVPSGTGALIVAIQKEDGSSITASDYDKVSFTIWDKWLYDAVNESIAVTDAIQSIQLATNANDWQNIFISPTGDSSNSNITLCTKNKLILPKNSYISASVNTGYKYRIIFFKSIGEGTIVAGGGYELVAGDYNDLNVWHTEKRVLSIPATAACYTITLRKVDDSDISVSECSNANISTTYGAEYIKDILINKDNIQHNAYSLLTGALKTNPYTLQNFKIEYVGNDTFHINGIPANGAEKSIIGDTSIIPTGLESGKTIYIAGMSDKVPFTVLEYINGTLNKRTYIRKPTSYTIGSNITGISICFYIAQGSYDDYIQPIVLNTYSNNAIFNTLRWQFENSFNVLDIPNRSSWTHNGITYSYDGSNWRVSGTSTATSWHTIVGGTNTIPTGIDTASLLKLSYSGTNVAIHVVQYDSTQQSIHSDFFYSDSVISIDGNTRGVEIRLRVASGVTLDETVTPILINHLNDGELSKEVYALRQVEDEDSRKERITQCAKSYYVMTRANQYTYGKRSALYFPSADPDYDPTTDIELNQVHCGGLSALIASGCTFFASRYNNPNGVNGSYTAGYGFDFEAYSLKLARNNVQSEIDYIGAENVNMTVPQLKELMLFKTSYQLSISCLRWNMIEYIQTGSTVDLSKVKIGDILFYGTENDGHQQWIDGHYIYPVLIEGHLIGHCDTVINIENGTPYVIDAGAAPITIHPFNLGTYYTYVCVGRLPLFDIVM